MINRKERTLITGSQPIRLVLDFAVAPSELEFDGTLKSHRWHGGLHAFTASRLVQRYSMILGSAVLALATVEYPITVASAKTAQVANSHF